MPGSSAAMADGALFQGVRKESAAFRLMQQMGWEEGSGLGKDKQGIKKHLFVKKKDDNSGVGANEAHNWTFNTTAFDNLLKNLKVQAGLKQEQKQTDTEEDEEEESEDEADVKQEVKVMKICRPQGRYKRMERGKIVENYSKEDLQSILGKSDNPAAKELTATPCFIIEQQITEVELIPNDQTDVEWWGSKSGFVKAGVLGSTSNVTQKKETFTENDQEQLYKAVQDKATKGKGGLGIGDRPKKIAGAHWKGQKIAFGEADDNDDEEKTSEDPEQKNVDKKRKRQKTGSQVADDGETRVKLKKLCKEFLLQAPERKSSLRKLQKHITASVGGDSFSDLDRLRKKLSKSSRFLIEGSRISLVPEVAC